ncbi:Molybdopterin molybdenumtransferase [Methyloligella halotolerans]|uniref:Molybdopterin molybdenumtransferase n=1 Tax=Methyloligella halotolerans TaxID=1177755 RepID=A0A1E2S1W5_9HYPH|nr:gephyrin-like molybdotransferase Glp [Methyloligella halotolerans]ODA68477.1 Molybdopterin molybdenumtransferase [Methyloligella halotolerans]
MSLLPVDEALARVVKGLGPLPAEPVSLGNARNRVLAEAVSANLTQPPFDASAMDGYAVRGDDVKSLPATLKLVGEAAAGSGYAAKVGAGEAVRIFTGAPVPRGADTVVPQENVETGEDSRRVTIREAEAGRHIRPQGQDFHRGEVVLDSGTVIGPRQMMLAAAANATELRVRRKPKVSILATGDELVPPGFDPAPDQIISSVPYGICGLVLDAGGDAKVLGIAEDTPDSLASMIAAGADADILVTVGGASVGDRDLVGQVLQAEGMTLDFWKIAMRPGKPLIFGTRGAQRILGLPGNPVSAMVCAHVFLRPMLARMLGLSSREDVRQKAILAAPLETNGPRQHYIRGTSKWNDAGERLVSPQMSQDSALMAAFAKADCLIVRPPEAPAAERGETVSVLPLNL